MAFYRLKISWSSIIQLLNIGHFATSLGAIASIAEPFWITQGKLKVSNKKRKTKNIPKSQQSHLRMANVLKALLPILLPLLVRRIATPTIRQPILSPYIHPTEAIRILSSVNSVTGRIVVGEVTTSENSTLGPLRYLRASHSLLGGVWLGKHAMTIDGTPSPVDALGTPIGDSIYSTQVEFHIVIIRKSR